MNGRSLGLFFAVMASATPFYANSQASAVSIDQTNAYYDLASLYGDTDHDGVLSSEEFNNFNPEKLSLHTDKRETWLGWIPTATKTYFYFYSHGSSSPWTSSDDLQEAKKKAEEWNYRITYQDSVKQDSDGNIVEGPASSAKAEFVNFYHGAEGFFYKFAFDYAVPEGGTHRLLPVSFSGSSGSRNPSFSVTDGEGEFWFDNSYQTENAVTKYFGYDSVTLDAVMDMYLAVEDQTTNYGWQRYCGADFFTSNTNITKAQEITYVFFRFPEGYSVDEVKYVNWTGVLDTYDAHKIDYIENVGTTTTHGLNKSIYSGRRADLTSRYDADDGKTVFDYSESVSSERKTGRTKAGDSGTVMQEDTASYYFFKDHKVRKSYYTDIVNMKTVDSRYTGDEWKNWKTFIDSGDHKDYDFAYRLNDDLHRSFISSTYTGVKKTGWAGILPDTIQYFELVSSCHEYRDVITLSMDVVKDNQDYTVKTIHDPLSVRAVSTIGYPAPTPAEVVIDVIADPSNWPRWMQILAIFLACIVGLVVLVFVVRFLRWVFRSLRDRRYYYRKRRR